MNSGRVGQAALAVALAIVVGWPALATVREAWIEGPAAGLDDGGVARPLGLAFETVRLVLAAEVIALPVGVLLAIGLFRTDLAGRRLCLALLATSAFVPMPIHAASWIGALGNIGRAQIFGLPAMVVGWPGAAFVHAVAAIPWVVLIVGVGLRSVEPELEESASMDLPAWRVAWRITLRRSIGAIAASALAVAVLTAGDMTVTDLVFVRSYAEEAYNQYAQGRGPGTASAVALPPILALGIAISLGASLLLRADPARLPSPNSRARPWRLGRARIPAGFLAGSLVTFLVILPVYGLAWRAGRVGGRASLGIAPQWSLAGFSKTLGSAFSEVVGPPEFILPTSLFWAAIAASAATALAWTLAWEARRPGSWRWVAAGSITIALATPGPVAGMALLIAYGGVRAIHATPIILVLAYVLRTFPYAFLILWPSLRGLPVAYFESSELDGCGPLGRAWRVALPLSKPSTLAAWGVAFVLAMGEVPASHPVRLPGMTTMTNLLWGLLHTGTESHLAGIVLVMLLPFALAGGLACLALGRAFTGSGSRTR